jgi:hypothetical protein
MIVYGLQLVLSAFQHLLGVFPLADVNDEA